MWLYLYKYVCEEYVKSYFFFFFNLFLLYQIFQVLWPPDFVLWTIKKESSELQQYIYIYLKTQYKNH